MSKSCDYSLDCKDGHTKKKFAFTKIKGASDLAKSFIEFYKNLDIVRLLNSVFRSLSTYLHEDKYYFLYSATMITL